MRKACGLAGLVLLYTATSLPAGGLLFKKHAPLVPPDTTLPLDAMQDADRAVARSVLEKPTLAARGPSETFVCRPDQYYWFLDHPDRAVAAWKRLGAKCVNISARDDGQFAWSDEHGGDLVWRTLHRSTGIHIWFAEGKVRPAAALPLVPLKALLVMHYGEAKNAEGKTVIEHHADLFLLTDSKTAATFTKMMGQSAPRIAEQGLGQLQMFFSGLSWYLQRHPEQVDVLLK
jgi:hypothetical protein